MWGGTHTTPWNQVPKPNVYKKGGDLNPGMVLYRLATTQLVIGVRIDDPQNLIPVKNSLMMRARSFHSHQIDE